MINKLVLKWCPNLAKHYVFIMMLVTMFAFSSIGVQANNATPPPNTDSSEATDIWTKANELIVDIYNQIVGISTVLAGLMSAVAVIGAKMSNNQHKVDQAWDWLRRIWIAWAVINGIGAFIAFVRPAFEGLSTIE